MIILTGIEGSGVEKIEKALIYNGYSRPLVFTTAEQQYDTELDKVVFIKKHLFNKKILNGDFIYYSGKEGIAKNIGENTVVVTNNVGRETLRKYANEYNIPIKTYYINISDEELLKNLSDYNINEINDIIKNKSNYSPSSSCQIIEGNWDSNLIIKLINDVNK